MLAASSVGGGILLPAAAHAQALDALMPSGGPLDLTDVLWLSVTAGCAAAAALTSLLLLRQRRDDRHAAAEQRIAEMRAALNRCETLLAADDQKIIVWDHADASAEVLGALPERVGAPFERAHFLAIGRWLAADSVKPLEEAVQKLRRYGEPFGLTVRSRTDAMLEVSGRTSGKRAVVRFRELSGERRSAAELQAQASAVAEELQGLRALAETLPFPVWRRDAVGRLVWVNAAYAAGVEAANPEAVVKAGVELLPSRARDAIRDAHRSGHAFQDSAVVNASGERRRFRIFDVPVEDGSIGLAIDASEVDAVRDEMRRNAESSARTLDQLTAAVAIFDRNRRLRFCNAAYRALWALPEPMLANGPEESALLDQLRAERKLPEQANYREWRRLHLEAYGAAQTREEWWHLPDGRSLRMVATPNAEDGLTYIWENVTEQLSLESRLQSLSRLQGETLNHLQEGVAVFGTDGRLRLFNPVFAEIWRLSPPTLRKTPHITEIIETCSAILPDTGAWDTIRAAVTGLEWSGPVSGRMNRPDGSAIDFATVALPEGMTMVTFVDVTDSARMQRALQERNEALEAADRLKSAFIGHVSYELRSPLTSIIGFVDMLSSETVGSLNPKQREYMDDIASSSASLLAIIDDILDLATVDAGIMALDIGEVDIRGVADAAVEGLRDRLAEQRISFVTHFPERIGTFRADESRVRQILFNLVSNAVRFSNAGGRIELKGERRNGFVIYTVRDNGIGIPEDILPTIFDRFEAHAPAGRRRGAGLGLSIVKSLAELHGGSVEISSVEGKGTTVTVRLPEAPHAPAIAAE